MNQQQIDRIIQRYLDGEAAADDLPLLENWLNHSQDNRRQFLDAAYFHRTLYDIVQNNNQELLDTVQSLIRQQQEQEHDQEQARPLRPSDLMLLDQPQQPVELVRMTQEEYDRIYKETHGIRDHNQTPTTTGNKAASTRTQRHGPTLSFAGIRLYTGVQREEMAYGFRMRYLAYAALFLAVIIFAAMQLWPKAEQEQVAEVETPPQVAHVEPEPPAAQPESPDPRPEPRPIIATIGRTINADWDKTVALESDMRLREGSRFTLTEGFIEIIMQRGARVVLEAPCVVALHDDNAMHLDRGRLYAHVPPQARYFTVHTPVTQIIDKGTEFGVEVDEHGVTSIACYEGEVYVAEAGVPLADIPRFAWLSKGWSAQVDRRGDVPEEVVLINEMDLSFVRSSEWLEETLAGLTNRNLIVNGDFEAGQSGEALSLSEVEVVPIIGWEGEGATVISYDHDVEEGFPAPGRHRVPDDHGRHFFIGNITTEMHQWIDLKDARVWIDAGGMQYQFSGWLGGFKHQDDPVTIVALFFDARGNRLKEATLGPLHPRDRSFETGFVYREAGDVVPPGTRRVRIEVHSELREGSIADAYADNLVFKLNVADGSHGPSSRSESQGYEPSTERRLNEPIAPSGIDDVLSERRMGKDVGALPTFASPA